MCSCLKCMIVQCDVWADVLVFVACCYYLLENPDMISMTSAILVVNYRKYSRRVIGRVADS